MTENQKTATEELAKQAEKAKSSGAARVAKEMIARMSEDENLADRFVDRGITLDAMWAYITEQARKEVKDGCACIEDKEVFGWATHFIIDGEMPKTGDQSGDAEKAEETGERNEEKPQKPIKTQNKRKTEDKPTKAATQMSLFDFLAQ